MHTSIFLTKSNQNSTDEDETSGHQHQRSCASGHFFVLKSHCAKIEKNNTAGKKKSKEASGKNNEGDSSGKPSLRPSNCTFRVLDSQWAIVI